MGQISERFPLFQSALSSVPFGGTYADPTVPQPTDTTAPPMPVADPSVAKRLKTIQEGIDTLSNFAHNIINAGPAANENPLLAWRRRMSLALHGTTETQETMRLKSDALAQTYNQINGLMQEYRLLTEPGPLEAKRQEEAGKGIFDAMERERRAAQIEAVNAQLRALGLKEVDPVEALQFTETGYGLDRPDSASNLLDEISKGADIGAKTGPGGIALLPKNLQPAGTAAFETAERRSTQKTTEKGKFAGFDTMAQLSSAVDREHDNILRTLGSWIQEPTGNVDPITRQPQYQLRLKVTPDEEIRARKAALSRFEGAEEFLPNYVTGQRPAPVAAPQGDLTPPKRTPEQLSEYLRGRKQGKKEAPKAGAK